MQFDFNFIQIILIQRSNKIILYHFRNEHSKCKYRTEPKVVLCECATCWSLVTPNHYYLLFNVNDKYKIRVCNFRIFKKQQQKKTKAKCTRKMPIPIVSCCMLIASHWIFMFVGMYVYARNWKCQPLKSWVLCQINKTVIRTNSHTHKCRKH